MKVVPNNASVTIYRNECSVLFFFSMTSSDGWEEQILRLAVSDTPVQNSNVTLSCKLQRSATLTHKSDKSPLPVITLAPLSFKIGIQQCSQYCLATEISMVVAVIPWTLFQFLLYDVYSEPKESVKYRLGNSCY